MLFWATVLSCIIALAGLIVFILVGFILAFIGVFDEILASKLGQVVYYVLYPSLSLSSLSQNLDGPSMLECWPLVFFSVFNIAVGTVWGWLITKWVPMDETFARQAIVTVATPNVASLPLHIAKVICSEGGPLFGFLTSHRYVAYISLSVLPVVLYNYGFIYQYLPDPPKQRIVVPPPPTEMTPLWPPPEDPVEIPLPEPEPEPEFVPPETWDFKAVVGLIFKAIVNPPVLATALGVLIAIIPPFKDLFWPSPDSTPYLNFLMDVVYEIGGSTVTILLLILGIRFALIFKNLNRMTIGAKEIAILTVSRLLLVPLVGLGLVALFLWADIFPHDRVMLFITLLELVPPPNTDLIVISQLLDLEVVNLSSALFVVYMVSIITVSVWSVLFVKFVQWDGLFVGNLTI